MIFDYTIRQATNLFLWIVRHKPLRTAQQCGFLFLKPSVEVSVRYQQEVLAFPLSLLSVRAPPQHKGRDTPRWASTLTRASRRKLTTGLWECDQSGLGFNEAGHVTHLR